MKKPPDAIFTIQRKSAPKSANRFLGTDDNGDKIWTTAQAAFDTFSSERAANTYRTFRMAGHADDCVVTRHPVH